MKDSRQQPQKAKRLSPTGGMGVRIFFTSTAQGGGGSALATALTSGTQRNSTVFGVVVVRCDLRTLARIEKDPGALQVPSWRFCPGRNRQPRAQGAPAPPHVQKNARRSKEGGGVLIRQRFLRALPAPTPHLPPPACISTCAMNTGKLHRREIEGRGAAVRGSKVKNIAIRSPLDALHDPPSHAGPRFACCARAARICGGALVQVIVWPVPTGTGRARSPKKRTPARRAESAHQYAFNSAQQSARHSAAISATQGPQSEYDLSSAARPSILYMVRKILNKSVETVKARRRPVRVRGLVTAPPLQKIPQATRNDHNNSLQ